MSDLIDPRPIWESLGIVDQASNDAYRLKVHDNPTEEDVELLSPDRINNRIFWECAPLFDNSSICGLGQTDHNAKFINTANRKLLGWYGALDYLSDIISPSSNRVVEFGPGYGSFYEWLPHYIKYIGFDVYPRFDKVIATEDNGIISREIIDSIQDTIDIVVCSNVFQHLSYKQVKQYFEDAFSILKKDRIFITGFTLDTKNKQRRHTYTAGQLIKGMVLNEVMELAINCGFSLTSYHTRYDGYTLFFFRT